MIQSAPKYSKVEILFKENVGSRILNEMLNSSTDLIKTFEDCGIMITGNFLLVILDNATEIPENVKYTKTNIFPLEQIEYYKIFNY